MSIKRIILVLMVCVIIFGNVRSVTGTVHQATTGCFRVLRSDDQVIILELYAGELQINSSKEGVQSFDTLSIAGLDQTIWLNKPQVPTCGGMIGLSSTQGISIEILEAQSETLQDIHLSPHSPYESGNFMEQYQGESTVKDSDTPEDGTNSLASYYPGKLVEIGEIGTLRDQAVAQVQFYPVQYDPARGEVRFYQHILVQINQGGKSKPSSERNRGASPQFEEILGSALANYTTLDRPKISSITSQTIDLNPASPAADGQQLKIGIHNDGFYQLTYDQLSATGFDFTGVDAHTLKITNRGTEIPILVEGEQDGQFNPGDRLLFYGMANADIYTTVNIYWLSAGGEPGMRMATRSGEPGAAQPATHFPVKLHAEQDTYYWQTMPNGAGQDHWFWDDRISSNSDLPTYREYPLSLNHISTMEDGAAVHVQLKGYTSDQFNSPDHLTRISINNQIVEPGQAWDGFAVFDLQVTFPHSLLQEGNNIIKVEAMPVSATVDQVFINWIELDYWDTYVADENMLVFTAPAAGEHLYQVDGFTTDDIRLLDITDPYATVIITDTVISSGTGYKLEFQDTATLETRYLALTEASLLSPTNLELDVPSLWKSPQNGADYILITHQDLITSALTLADYHTNSGLRVVTVDIDDIFDEFNYGVFNPQAIRDFLAYTYQNWQAPAPVYILLLGEASYDYRDLLGIGRTNYVPTQMIETVLLGETASDNWLVTFNGDDILPDMIVGRLPASNLAEAEVMVDKVIAYDQNPPDESWNKQVLLIADDGDPGFKSINELIDKTLPRSFIKNKVYQGEYSGDIKAAILNNINQGSLFTNFAGHGNPITWGGFFNNTDVALLDNPGKLTIVTVGNCLSGFFVGKSNPSISEAFMQLPDEGAVAVWAPSGVGYPAGHQDMLGEFYELIYGAHLSELGVVTTTAKINVYGRFGAWGDLVETFIYFGDPLTRVRDIPYDSYLPITQK